MRPGGEEASVARRRLADPDCPRDYIIVGELIAEGFTDYLAQPLVYTTGETNVASWSTKAPGGFSEEGADALSRVNAPLARLTEGGPGRYRDAAEILDGLVLSPTFVEFLTLPAYRHLD